MRESVGEFAVVCQEDEPDGVVIEASDGEEAWRGGVVDEFGDGASVGPRLVLGRREGSRRLIEHDVELAIGLRDDLAGDDDAVFLWIDPCWEGGDELAIDGHIAVFDHGFAGASRTDAGVGEHALEAFAAGCVGEIVLWLVSGHERVYASIGGFECGFLSVGSDRAEVIWTQ